MGYLGIIIAAIAQVIIGSLWYGPFFGDTWMKLSGIKKPKVITSEIKRKMIGSYIWMFIGAIVMSYVLKIVILQFPFASVAGVSITALIVWLGFIVPVQAGTVLWEGKPFKLYILNITYYLVTMVVSALILLKI